MRRVMLALFVSAVAVAGFNSLFEMLLLRFSCLGMALREFQFSI